MKHKKTKKIIKNQKILKSLLILILAIVFLSGVFSFAPHHTSPFDIFGAVTKGSFQGSFVSSSKDLFSCGVRDDCSDDVTVNYAGPQHEYFAQAYDRFGFPLANVKYKWTKDDSDDLLKFIELDCAINITSVACLAVTGCAWDVALTPSCNASGIVDESVISGSEIDQSIYVQPNDQKLQNGEATVNVLGYIGNDPSRGKTQSIDINIYFCLNTWPNTDTFPFEDSGGFNPKTNFKTYYCQDRGSAVDSNDDYPSLKIIERSEQTVDDSFLCSGGGGNNLSCVNDYYIDYGDFTGSAWDKKTLGDTSTVFTPTSIFSPDAIANFQSGVIIFFKDDIWENDSGTGTLPTSPFGTSWPAGITNPTAVGYGGDGPEIVVIQDNLLDRSTDGGITWSGLISLAEDAVPSVGGYGPWPKDVQFPTDIAIWGDGSGNKYTMALKDDYYRIYSSSNICDTDLKCLNLSGRKWGNCTTTTEAADCYWGERFSLYEQRDWPTSTVTWSDNINSRIKTIGLEKSASEDILVTSSCERSGGICLLKEFLLISNSACSDGIDNDNDGQCDWQDDLCGVGIDADSDCTGPDDNSESGTCSDGIDNDNDGFIDMDDFSCSAYGDVEEKNTCSAQCCNNKDDDNDGLIDQSDGGCSDKDDNQETNECADGADSLLDGDTLVDLADPGCVDLLDDSELGVIECDDGIDNDGDGYIDLGTDNGCDDAYDNNEIEVCVDGVDNDGDGKSDLLDFGCTGINDNSEIGTTECGDGVDNDSDGFVDQDDFDCANASDNDESA